MNIEMKKTDKAKLVKALKLLEKALTLINEVPIGELRRYSSPIADVLEEQGGFRECVTSFESTFSVNYQPKPSRKGYRR